MRQNRTTRAMIAAATTLVAGCVQQAPMGYSPGPYPLQPYGAPVPYRYDPSYTAPAPYPLQSTVPAPYQSPLPDAAPAPAPDSGSTDSGTGGGAIPLQDMPAPTTPADAAPSTTSSPASSDASPAPRQPSSGPGSNIPLEGFRPMRGQTRPAP